MNYTLNYTKGQHCLEAITIFVNNWRKSRIVRSASSRRPQSGTSSKRNHSLRQSINYFNWLCHYTESGPGHYYALPFSDLSRLFAAFFPLVYGDETSTRDSSNYRLFCVRLSTDVRLLTDCFHRHIHWWSIRGFFFGETFHSATLRSSGCSWRPSCAGRKWTVTHFDRESVPDDLKRLKLIKRYVFI